MSSISATDVKKLAALSALNLSDEQIQTLRDDMIVILGYFEQLQTVDTDGVEPTYEVHGLENVMRKDEVIDYGLGRDELLASAPEHTTEHIVVPRVLE